MVGMSKRLTAAAVASWASRRGSAKAFVAVVARRPGRGRRGGVDGGVAALVSVAGAPRSRGDRRAARAFWRLARARTIGWLSAAVRLENARARHVASIQRPDTTVDSRFSSRVALQTCESVEGSPVQESAREPLRGASAGDAIFTNKTVTRPAPTNLGSAIMANGALHSC